MMGMLLMVAFTVNPHARVLAQKPSSLMGIPAEGSGGAFNGRGGALIDVRQNERCAKTEPVIVIGFMGGLVHADDPVHLESQLARDLDRRYPDSVHAFTFANRNEAGALSTVLKLLDTSKDGQLSDAEKTAARIVIFGHSWGASEAINFARDLDRRGIPVLLTVQVDSVQKSGEDDGSIPANVREAINFYQTEGLLHGRRSIQAVDPKRTRILGSYESSYKNNPVSCDGFGWFARTFMRPHIEIENDRVVWETIEELILDRSGTARSSTTDTAAASGACREK